MKSRRLRPLFSKAARTPGYCRPSRAGTSPWRRTCPNAAAARMAGPAQRPAPVFGPVPKASWAGPSSSAPSGAGSRWAAATAPVMFSRAASTGTSKGRGPSRASRNCGGARPRASVPAAKAEPHRRSSVSARTATAADVSFLVHASPPRPISPRSGRRTRGSPRSQALPISSTRSVWLRPGSEDDREFDVTYVMRRNPAPGGDHCPS